MSENLRELKEFKELKVEAKKSDNGRLVKGLLPEAPKGGESYEQPNTKR